MNKYKYLIFDVDDTLLDFGCAFYSAQRKTAELLGADYSDEFREADERTGWRAWDEMSLNDTGDPDIQRNYHQYYNNYLILHYGYLLEELGLDADCERVAACYKESIAASSVLCEDCALDVLRELAERYKLVLATNGLTEIQGKRIGVLKPYIYRTFISEEMGAIKPTRDFYSVILDSLGCAPEECLMIGDSVTNDIVGAKSAGMAACYYNPKNKEIRSGVSCDHVISSLSELPSLLK